MIMNPFETRVYVYGSPEQGKLLRETRTLSGEKDIYQVLEVVPVRGNLF
jgi:hypothetical protein